MKEITLTVTMTEEGVVRLNGERIGEVGQGDGVLWPHEGRMTIHTCPAVPTHRDEFAHERAAMAVVAWHMLKAEKEA